ncbi:lantibiotic immunity ABC transporter MutG family permease subunit [Paenibacillus baekrokdamisoli]|uniref:lantibiotic immunity ABC transporter MutG family permease subunit n=1 Tax=Paenibacillus baekrokdamisoli TaxID=1712516 RepID=UPI0022B2609D|nr:lantibiotic immunity ABC transporter MutG family permease subunit [Paenibacillus baekrokdamisoli]
MTGQRASRLLIYFGKLLQLTLLCAAVLLSAILILLLGMNLALRIEHIEYGLFLQGGTLALTGALSLLPLHLFLSLAYGQGASIGAGCGGFLIAGMIGTTTIGDAIWQFVPWAWSVRLSWNPILFMPNLSLGKTIQLAEVYQQNMDKGLAPVLICFLFLTLLGIVWFGKWEGRKSYE